MRMQYASMVAKGSTGDPTVLPAHEVLEMATIRGAKALGLDKDIGSLKVRPRFKTIQYSLQNTNKKNSKSPKSHSNVIAFP